MKYKRRRCQICLHKDTVYKRVNIRATSGEGGMYKKSTAGTAGTRATWKRELRKVKSRGTANMGLFRGLTVKRGSRGFT